MLIKFYCTSAIILIILLYGITTFDKTVGTKLKRLITAPLPRYSVNAPIFVSGKWGHQHWDRAAGRGSCVAKGFSLADLRKVEFQCIEINKITSFTVPTNFVKDCSFLVQLPCVGIMISFMTSSMYQGSTVAQNSDLSLLNPRPPETFSVTRPPKGIVATPSLEFLY